MSTATHVPNCPFLVSSSSPLILTFCSFCSGVVEGGVDMELSRRRSVSGGSGRKGGKYQDILDGEEGKKEAKKEEGQVFIRCRGKGRRSCRSREGQGRKEVEGKGTGWVKMLARSPLLPSEKKVSTEMRRTRRSGLPVARGRRGKAGYV